MVNLAYIYNFNGSFDCSLQTQIIILQMNYHSYINMNYSSSLPRTRSKELVFVRNNVSHTDFFFFF